MGRKLPVPYMFLLFNSSLNWKSKLKIFFKAFNTSLPTIWVSMQVYNTCRYISLLPASLMLIFAEIDIQRCVQDSIKIFCSTPKSATFRQHAREPNKSSNTRPNVSYYSRDYHEQPKSELVRIVWNNSEWQDSIDYLYERNKNFIFD